MPLAFYATSFYPFPSLATVLLSLTFIPEASMFQAFRPCISALRENLLRKMSNRYMHILVCGYVCVSMNWGRRSSTEQEYWRESFTSRRHFACQVSSVKSINSGHKFARGKSRWDSPLRRTNSPCFLPLVCVLSSQTKGPYRPAWFISLLCVPKLYGVYPQHTTRDKRISSLDALNIAQVRV